MFVNQKLYGKKTQDDPVNNINLVMQMRHASAMLKHNDSIYGQKKGQNDSKMQSNRTKNFLRGTKDLISETIGDLNRKTDFVTSAKPNNFEKNVDSYLADWYGTTKGLPLEWTRKVKGP